MNVHPARLLAIGTMVAVSGAVTVSSQIASGAAVPTSASSSSSPGTTPTSGSTASSTPVSTPAAVSSVPVAGSTTQFSYRAGDAATVILDSAGGALRLVAFAPHPGWFTVGIGQASATELDARLESSAGQVRFVARLVDGIVITELDLGTGQAIGTSGNSTPGNSTPGTGVTANTTPGGDDGGGSGRGGNDDVGGDDSGGSGGHGSDD